MAVYPALFIEHSHPTPALCHVVPCRPFWSLFRLHLYNREVCPSVLSVRRPSSFFVRGSL